MPLNFTVTYDDRTNDNTDVTGDIAAVAATGPVYFIPTIPTGYRIPDAAYLPRPTGLSVRAFPAFLDADGQLKPEAGGTVGVRLWANDPSWGLPRMQYQVRATLTDHLGEPVPWATFYFDAPSEDIEVKLALEMPLPGQKFARGRPGFGLARDGLDINGSGQLVFSREDGYELDPVTVPTVSETLTQAAAAAIAHTLTFGR
jgi:hypothetical protein